MEKGSDLTYKNQSMSKIQINKRTILQKHIKEYTYKVYPNP